MRVALLLAVGPLIGSVAVAPARGQCDPVWSDQFSASGHGISNSVYALAAYAGDGINPPMLYAGGRFFMAGGVAANHVAQWDGSSWSALASGTNHNVYALCVADEDGAGPNPPVLYVGGRFSSAGGVQADLLAKWDGATWSPVTPPFVDGAVHAITFSDDDAGGPNPPALCMAGDFGFHTPNGLASKVAKWDGNEWFPVGGPIFGGVLGALALAVFDEDGSGPVPPALFAGGDFVGIGSISVNNIARWDGTSWSAVAAGWGVGGTVYALTVFDDDGVGPNLPSLFVGGDFHFAPGPLGIFANNVINWDGSSWSALGDGVDGNVRALVVHDDDGAGPSPPALYAGGSFNTAGGRSAARVAKWDGMTWSALGAGIEGGAVSALVTLDDDGPGSVPPALFAGGVIASAGGVESLSGGQP